jgi:hypothetical protein
MGNITSGYSKEQASTIRAPFILGDIQVTPTMSATGTQNIKFTGPIAQVTLQSTGDLTYTYAPTVNGVNFGTPSSTIAANALAFYDETGVTGMQITWVSGSGTVVLLGNS